MQFIQKNFLIFTFALSLCLLPQHSALASGTEKPDPSILSVNGSGQAEAAPDLVSVSIGVTTHGEIASVAQSENTAQVQAVIEGLKQLGIDAKDIQTSSYSFQPTYRSSENHERELSGYAVDNTIHVLIRDIHLAGRAIDTALRRGANQVHALDFRISDTQALRKKALLAAIRDAREKADIIASGLGHRIIGIRQVSENTGVFQSRKYNSMMLAEAMTDAATPMEPGTVSLDAEVHIEFILSD